MRNEFALFSAMMALVGCATPPEHSTSQHQTAYHAETLAAQLAEPPIEQDLDGPHDVNFYVQMALERNPEIVAAQHKVAAQNEVIPQATSLQDPMLMDSFFPANDNSPQTAAGRAPNMLSLSQQLPWMGKLRARGDVASHQAQMALTELASAQLKTTEGVKLAYYDLWFNQQAIVITDASGSLLTDLLKFAEARYRTGGSQQDIFRAQLEIDRLKTELIRFRRELGVSQADLAKLLHTSQDAMPEAKSLGETVSAPEEIDRLYAAAIQCRPELKKQLHAIARDQHAVELACLEYYPNITTAISWQAIAKSDSLSPVSNGNDNIGFGIGISLPIWQDKLDAGVREAEHRMASSTRMYDAERDDTFRMIKRLSVQARALDEQIKLFRDSILPRAEQTLKVSVADYRVGKVDFQQIIDNWTALLRFRIQVIRLEASLGQVLASLERVVGCELASVSEPATEPEPLGTKLQAAVPPKPDNAELEAAPPSGMSRTSRIDFHAETAIQQTAHQTASKLPSAVPPVEPMHFDSDEPMADSMATFSVENFETLALAGNPTLVQAQAQIQAASGAAQQAGLYFNPVVGYSGEFDRIGAGPDETWNGGYVSQEFVMGGKLRLSQQKWSQRVRIAETNFYAQQRRVLNDVRIQFYRTLAAQQLVDVHRELLANGEDHLQTSREMLNLGQTNQAGLLNAEVALQRDRLNLMQAEKEFQHAWRTLTSLAGSPELAPAKLAGVVAAADESLDWDSALSQLLSSSPELQAAWQAIEHDRITVEREEAEPIPNLLVDMSSIHTAATNTTQTTLNVGIPLPIFDRNQGTVEQAQADLAQAHAEARRLELELRTRLATKFRDYDTSRQRAEDFEATMLPKAKQAYDLLHESYKARRAAWPDVLMAQRQYLSLRAEQINNQLMHRESDVAVRGMLLTGGLTSPPPPVGAGHIDAVAKPR